MGERENVQKLSELKTEIDRDYSYWRADNLEEAVLQTLQVNGPYGKPKSIEETALAIRNASIDVDTAVTAVERLRKVKLPEAWSGQAHVAADDALKALERELHRVMDTFTEARKQLEAYADKLKNHQALDAKGMGPLESARDRLRGHTGLLDFGQDDSHEVVAAHRLAQEGIADRIWAAKAAVESAETTAIALRDLAGAAHLSRLSGSTLDPVSELVISDAGGSGDADELILTPAMTDRATEAMERLSPSDRQRLEKLLADAKSPEERAYILKALAAGHSMDEVAGFDKLIHDHGNDPVWLKDRLAPMDLSRREGNWDRIETLSQGKPWSQHQDPTCAAVSTLMGRAQVDPVYALQLTTGGHPGDPAFDNPQAFEDRLRDEQRGADMAEGGKHDPAEAEALARKHLSPATGMQYENQMLEDADQRREALRKAEGYVDQGVPVPVGVSPYVDPDNPGKSHQLLIVGHDGDRIQVYNPHGYTVWITEDDFINGRMSVVGRNVPDVPRFIEMPK